MLFFCPLVALEDEIDGGRVREFRGAAEAAVLDVEKLGDGFDLRFDDAEVELGALVAIGIGNGEKNAAKTGAAHLVFGREIGAAEKRFAIGEQKTGERPAALAGNGADGGLIAGVDVGTLVTVNFYGDEVFVDDLGNFDVLVAFAVDDVAPVAPDGADVEKDGLVLGFGAGKGGVSPFVPIDGLAGGGTQVGAGGVFQAVFGMVCQSRSQFEPAKNGQLRSFASLRMTPERSTGLPRQGWDAKKWKTGHDIKITEWCRRGRGRAGRAVCGSRILRPGDGKSGCGPRRASSRDRHPVY